MQDFMQGCRENRKDPIAPPFFCINSGAGAQQNISVPPIVFHHLKIY